MSNTIRHYSFKYMDDKQRIYGISRHQPHPIIVKRSYDGEIYTVPFVHRQESARMKQMTNTRNAIVAFTSYEQCKAHANTLGDCLVMDMQLYDMKYVATLFNMPLIVILATYCDVADRSETHDLYFYQNSDLRQGIRKKKDL